MVVIENIVYIIIINRQVKVDKLYLINIKIIC